MSGKSWEDMAREVLVEGNPAEVRGAALDWEEVLRNVGEVQTSLKTNIGDLGKTWKGPAYDAFKGHIDRLGKDIEGIVDAVSDPGSGRVGIVPTLETAAAKIEKAQAEMPIPAACVGDVLAARNGEITLGVGLFETRVKADLLGSWPAEQLGKLGDWVTGWFSDQEGDARKVYNTLEGGIRETAEQGPKGGWSGVGTTPPPPPPPELGRGGGGGGGAGSVPGLGNTPGTGGISGSKVPSGVGGGPGIGSGGGYGSGSGVPGIGTGAHPDLSGGGYSPGTGTGTGYVPGGPGAGGIGAGGGGYSTGLAGAAPATTGLGGGPGAGGLSAGLGGGGAGSGLSGGGAGALGKPVNPGLPPMMGGGAAGAGGRNAGGRGAGGRLGAGRTGAGGGMGPAMGGMAGGGGGRGAGRGAAGAGGGGARGAGARGGMAGVGAGSGAGYGEEELPRNSWLEEDEDVWGGDGGAAPGVLR
ncbi:hypothetical protein AB0H57_05085 [Micromonospora sp. NPDC050686]|uniref:WXG100 family type VII secretion target n=1 Tax=Micromonospora sp. NPDC050686 TaxID=3154631 RepID=UPI0034061BC3